MGSEGKDYRMFGSTLGPPLFMDTITWESVRLR